MSLCVMNELKKFKIVFPNYICETDGRIYVY